MRPFHAVILLACIAGLLAGCGSEPQPDLPRAFVYDPAADADAAGMHPQSKYLTYEIELQRCCPELPRMDHRDYAMLAANRAMIVDSLGEPGQARQAVMDSQAVMTGKVKGESGKAVAAALADENAKVFKGECYEIAMLNSLIGLYSLRMGDDETAAIGFRRAIEADKMSKEEARADFLLAYWGLGMASLQRDPANAAAMFRRCNYKPAAAVADENVAFLVSLGRAPSKRLTGLYGAHDTFVLEPYEPRSAEIFVDGVSLGKPRPMINLYEQSQGVPRTDKDVGQGGKAAGKLALAIVAGVALGDAGQSLVENAWSVKADTRTCYMLPNEVHVMTAKLAPGPHAVRVKFYGAAGNELPRYEQVWNHVVIRPGRREYISLRSEFDRCNVQGPIAFTRISKVKTQRVDDQTQKTTLQFRAANLPKLVVGDEIRICHFYQMTQERWDHNYHWRYRPMAYNNKGQPIGYPGSTLRMRDYDIGLVGRARVTAINDDKGTADVISLTTDYRPQKGHMLTNARRRGRIWMTPITMNGSEQ